MIKTKFKNNDLVKVIAGKDKGATGKIQKIDLEKGKVIVAGVNMVFKTKKKRSQEEQGGIINIEAPINISNIQLVSKNSVSRIGYKMVGNEKKRIAKKTGEEL